jgi:Fe-S-cluster-containing hydrogenase component 2
MITIDSAKCVGCGGCIDLCPEIAIAMIDNKASIDGETCNECKTCVKVCPLKAPVEAA